MLTRTKLRDAIAARCAITQSLAGEAIDAIIDEIGFELHNGGEVRVTGLGTFSVADRAASEGRNPRTGEAITIGARRVAKFSPAKALKDRLNP